MSAEQFPRLYFIPEAGLQHEPACASCGESLNSATVKTSVSTAYGNRVDTICARCLATGGDGRAALALSIPGGAA